MIVFLLFIFFCLFSVAAAITNCIKNNKLIEQVTPLSRGEWSERRLILQLLKAGVNPRAIFHDLYIQKANGEYVQIDVAVATKSGIIVFEVKDYSGWIFGNEKQRYWTQILAYGKEKHRFYNPIMQNASHIKVLRARFPHNPDIPMFSAIVFYGNCTLKDVTIHSANTYVMRPSSIRKFIDDIMQCRNAAFGDKYEIMNVLTNGVNNGLNPYIVSSQRLTVSRYSQNKPQSTYYHNVWRFLKL